MEEIAEAPTVEVEVQLAEIKPKKSKKKKAPEQPPPPQEPKPNSVDTKPTEEVKSVGEPKTEPPMVKKPEPELTPMPPPQGNVDFYFFQGFIFLELEEDEDPELCFMQQKIFIHPLNLL